MLFPFLPFILLFLSFNTCLSKLILKTTVQFKCIPTETENKPKQQTTVLQGGWLILVTTCHKYLKVDSLRQADEQGHL